MTATGKQKRISSSKAGSVEARRVWQGFLAKGQEIDIPQYFRAVRNRFRRSKVLTQLAVDEFAKRRADAVVKASTHRSKDRERWLRPGWAFPESLAIGKRQAIPAGKARREHVHAWRDLRRQNFALAEAALQRDEDMCNKLDPYLASRPDMTLDEAIDAHERDHPASAEDNP